MGAVSSAPTNQPYSKYLKVNIWFYLGVWGLTGISKPDIPILIYEQVVGTVEVIAEVIVE
jgi:hypothetical protein